MDTDKKDHQKRYSDVQVQLFLRGIKPTAYYAYQKERASKLRKLNYPYILVICEGVLGCLFFKTKQAMYNFMKNHGMKQPIMPLNHVLIGKALGYPPQAYNDFDIEREDRHIIHYHGFDFVCRKRNLKECVLYMKEHYVIPKDLYIEVSIIKPKIKKAVG